MVKVIENGCVISLEKRMANEIEVWNGLEKKN